MTTRNFLAVAFILTCFHSNAQSWKRNLSISSPAHNLNWPTTTDHYDSFVQARNIQSVHITATQVTKKGKEKPRKFFWNVGFDSLGRISTFQVHNDKRKKLNYTGYYSYNDQGSIIKKYFLDSDGNTMSTFLQSFDSNQRRVKYVHLNDKGDTLDKTLKTAIGSDLISYDYYYRKGKLKSQWKNEYYPNHERKKTSFYKSNGKLKYVWDYRCKDEGVEVNKHKDTTKRCVARSTDNAGITTVVYHTVSEKGILYKAVNKRNSRGKWFYYKRTRGADDEILSERISSFYEGDTVLKQVDQSYFQKGKRSSLQTKKYDIHGNETENSNTYYNKEEVSSYYIQTYSYNDSNQPIEHIIKNETKGSRRIVHYTYP